MQHLGQGISILLQSTETSRVKKINLMHNSFLVYFANLYMFRAYVGLSSGGTTVCIQQLVLFIFLDDCLFSWLDRTLVPIQ